MPELTTAQLAALCDAEIEGDGARILSGANTLETASEADLAFVDNARAFAAAAQSRAGCLVVPPDFDHTGSWSLIRVKSVRAAFARAVSALYAQAPVAPSIHPTAVIDSTASVSSDAFVGAHVSIGAHTHVAAHCYIAPGCRIGNRVTLGEGTTLHPNVIIYDGVRLGKRVILHAGCVIGADGFGYILAGDRYEKFPQIGTVEIEDDVEIGANSCVDRAALGVTRIGSGTKLDNLVHVAHNCVLGKHIVIAAQAGLSGSVTIGDYAAIGGQAGIGEKAQIAPKSVVGGKAGVLTGQRIEAGEPVWGIPARPLRQHLKNLAHINKLPRTEETVRDLTNRVKKLEIPNEIS
jgi:UDP-3-O-[3-hydroxymyristoyl] glucosamine N-acyltransferase